MKYKIIYHVGDDMGIKTKVDDGFLIWQEKSILISNSSSSFEIPFSSLKSVEMYRMYGLARMLKLVCLDKVIFLTVVRFNIAGYFITVNFLKAGELFNKLKAQISQ